MSRSRLVDAALVAALVAAVLLSALLCPLDDYGDRTRALEPVAMGRAQ